MPGGGERQTAARVRPGEPVGAVRVDERRFEQAELELRPQQAPNGRVDGSLGHAPLPDLIDERPVCLHVGQLDVHARREGPARRLRVVRRDVM